MSQLPEYIICLVLILWGTDTLFGQQESTRDHHSGSYISAAWENDMYHGRDYYYTGGFEISFYQTPAGNFPFHRICISGSPKTGGNGWSGIRLRQEIFTPIDLEADSLIPGGHPYAATLAIAREEIAVWPYRELRITSVLRLGILGPASLGSVSQKIAHRIANPSRPPQGWEHQIQNDLILNYDVKMEKGVGSYAKSWFGVHGQGRLGTVNTDLAGGLWYRFDPGKRYFKTPRPYLDNRLHTTFHLSGGGRYVIYDAVLQGGLFNNSSPQVVERKDLIPWIWNGSASVSIEWLKHQVEVFSYFRTPNFLSGRPHSWMGIKYRYWL